MNPDNEPKPIDPPDNTSTSDGAVDADATAGETAQAPAINPPDNT